MFCVGLNGKDNMEKARCDVIVDALKEVRTEMRPVTPYYMKETDPEKIVCIEFCHRLRTLSQNR